MLSPQFVEVFRTATSTLGGGIPTGTPTAVPAIPTVMPNRPTFERAEDAGKTTLWVVFVLMLLSTLVLSYLSWKTPVQKRLFHIITTFITAFATLSYFAMATGSGVSYTHFVIRETHKHVPTTYEHVFRQVYWARYVDWSITTPLLLLDLSFLAGISGANILVAIVADLVMILTGLFAALVEKKLCQVGMVRYGLPRLPSHPLYPDHPRPTLRLDGLILNLQALHCYRYLHYRSVDHVPHRLGSC